MDFKLLLVWVQPLCKLWFGIISPVMFSGACNPHRTALFLSQCWIKDAQTVVFNKTRLYFENEVSSVTLRQVLLLTSSFCLFVETEAGCCTNEKTVGWMVQMCHWEGPAAAFEWVGGMKRWGVAGGSSNTFPAELPFPHRARQVTGFVFLFCPILFVRSVFCSFAEPFTVFSGV